MRFLMQQFFNFLNLAFSNPYKVKITGQQQQWLFIGFQRASMLSVKMSYIRKSFSIVVLNICLTLLLISPVFAESLKVAKETSILLHWGAKLLLYAHIGGGIIGMLAGTAASLAPKGKRFHRKAGQVFYFAMLICYLIGALVAPFLESGQRTNFVAGILALYLLTSGVSAARRHKFSASLAEKIGLVTALTITLLGAYFILLASNSPTGTIDDSPPQAFILFVVAGSLALIGEIRVLYKKTLTNVQRTIRHLWRMCFSFFIASGSLFFGQPGVFPDWFNGSLLPLLFGFFPFLVLLIFLGKQLITARTSNRPNPT